MRDIVLKGHHLSQQLAGCHSGLGSLAPQLSSKMTIFTAKFQGSYEFLTAYEGEKEIRESKEKLQNHLLLAAIKTGISTYISVR